MLCLEGTSLRQAATILTNIRLGCKDLSETSTIKAFAQNVSEREKVLWLSYRALTVVVEVAEEKSFGVLGHHLARQGVEGPLIEGANDGSGLAQIFAFLLLLDFAADHVLAAPGFSGVITFFSSSLTRQK